MREVAFALEYAPGSNRVADALAEYPGARIRSLSLHVTADRLWRVDHATGSAAALDAIETAFRSADYYADCLATEHCGATQRTEVLDHTEDTLVLYSYWERTPACASVPHIARDHLGEGVLFETRHEGRHYTWRLMHPGDGDVAAFFDELEDALGEAASMEMLRTGETGADPADGDVGSVGEVGAVDARDRGGAEASGARQHADGLSADQQAALEAAVEHGYYESPREVDLADLAEHLDVPRSTLTYRLRRAEEHLAKAHVAGGSPAATDGRPGAR